jgi:chromosome partitioning protein
LSEHCNVVFEKSFIEIGRWVGADVSKGRPPLPVDARVATDTPHSPQRIGDRTSNNYRYGIVSGLAFVSRKDLHFAIEKPSGKTYSLAYMSNAARRAGLEELKAFWNLADQTIESSREQAMRPENRKVLRPFVLKDVCKLLDIHSTVFYDKTRDVPELAGVKVNNQRQFGLADIHRLQEHLGKLPRQLYDIQRAVTVSVANFKGGVAKTFTAVTLAQYFALRGYRTLMIDTDPQGSLTTTFGLRPSMVDDWKTILPYLYGRTNVEALGHTWPKSFAECIDATYWPGLDIVAANLELYSGEFLMQLRRNNDENFRFHTPIRDAIEDVRGQYDIIVIDNPPALSLSTAAALFAADALIVPTPAEMLDFESARAFIKLATEIMQAVENSFGERKVFEIFRVLVTKFKPASASHQNLAGTIRQIFGDYCVSEPMVQSEAVQRLAEGFLTLYEADPRAPGRAALKRALDAAKDVNTLIESDFINLFRVRQEAAKTSATNNDEPGNQKAA